MTEFKEALTWIEEQISVSKSRGIAFVQVYEDIRRALLIADRLMREPSVSMLSKLDNGFLTSLSADAFKAMRDQLIREIGQGSKCNHEGYSFKEHGRCCPKCGDFLTDFGD